MSNQPQPLVITLAEAAKLLRRTRSQMYELCRKRSRSRHPFPLPVFKIGKQLCFRRESLEAWVKQLENGGQR